MTLKYATAITVLLLMPPERAFPADAATCAAYVKEAVGKAQGVKLFNCGFDSADPRWSTDSEAHARWCRDADKDSVAREAARRRGEINLCQTCRLYADGATRAVAEVFRLKCGFEGPRWSASAGAHFGWCMAHNAQVPEDEKELASLYRAALEKLQPLIDLETGTRVRETAACRLRQKKPRPPRT